MNRVPFSRLIDGIEPHFKEYIDKITSLIKNTNFIGGEEVKKFECEFSKWTNSKYCIGTANGTDAIIVALKALGIGYGDKVLVPDNTFIATAEAVTSIGAKVDFIDVEKDYATIDPIMIEKYLNTPKGKNVKAIIPVHLYGQMANMPAILEIAKRHEIMIIEDSAQAHGAKYFNKQPGFYGNIATYSFYPGKNIGAFGDAGAITCNDEDLERKCRLLVNHGRLNKKYEHEIEAYNMRIDTLQAAILRIKLLYIDEWTSLRQSKVKYYLEKLDEISCALTPRIRENSNPVWHILPIYVNDRDNIMNKLLSFGIECGVHYPIPLHLQPAYKYLGYKEGDFFVSEMLAKSELSLPLWPEIEYSDIDYVIKCIKEIMQIF